MSAHVFWKKGWTTGEGSHKGQGSWVPRVNVGADAPSAKAPRSLETGSPFSQKEEPGQSRIPSLTLPTGPLSPVLPMRGHELETEVLTNSNHSAGQRQGLPNLRLHPGGVSCHSKREKSVFTETLKIGTFPPNRFFMKSNDRLTK